MFLVPQLRLGDSGNNFIDKNYLNMCRIAIKHNFKEVTAMFKRISVLTAAIFALSASVSTADEIRIATGPTFIKAVFDPIKAPFKAKTGLDIKILIGGPAPSLGELEKGNVEIAGASLPLDNWLEVAKKAGVATKEGGAYITYIPITEKASVMVNSENKVKSLSNEQLKGIFTGKLQNWNEVGGDDAPILVVWPSLSSGALSLFQAKILDNEPVTKTVYDVATINDTSGAIAGTVEAIGIVGGSTTEKGVKEVAPPLERPLTLVYKGAPSANLQKLLDFLKQDGNKYFKH
jgi:phosphate transport system substrate-binding protein